MEDTNYVIKLKKDIEHLQNLITNQNLQIEFMQKQIIKLVHMVNENKACE